MLSEQLYYPNIVPDVTPEFALSLLHWDKVVRIFPKQSLKSGIYQPSLISALEYEGFLESEQLDETDKDKCWKWFDKIVASAGGPMGPRKLEAELLVKQCHIGGQNNYFINYARKPQAFKPGDEWHPFEAKPGETWRSGVNSGMIWLWPDI